MEDDQGRLSSDSLSFLLHPAPTHTDRRTLKDAPHPQNHIQTHARTHTPHPHPRQHPQEPRLLEFCDTEQQHALGRRLDKMKTELRQKRLERHASPSDGSGVPLLRSPVRPSTAPASPSSRSRFGNDAIGGAAIGNGPSPPRSPFRNTKLSAFPRFLLVQYATASRRRVKGVLSHYATKGYAHSCHVRVVKECSTSVEALEVRGVEGGS